MKYLKVFTDFAEAIEELNDSERGRLFTAMLNYARTGEEPTLRGNERFLWGTAKKSIDNQRDAYDARCEINKTIATNRYESLRIVTKDNESLQDKDKDKDKDEKKGKKISTPRAAFVPPSVEDVREQCRMMHYEYVEPEEFVRFYGSKNWYVGKNKMTDWKQALGGWESRAKRRGDPKVGETPKKAGGGRLDNLRRLYEEEVRKNEPTGGC